MKGREAFLENIERCRALLQINRQLWPRRPAKKGDDLLRATITLAVSALDSYIHDIVAENAPTIAMAFAKGYARPPGKLLEVLKPSLDPENALRLIGRGRPDEQIRKLVGAHIKERSFQDPEEIERALRLIGLDDLWEGIRKRFRLTTKSAAKEMLVEYVNRRHRVVHEADRYKTKRHRGKLRPITRPYTVNCVRDVTKFVNALDKVVAAHMARAVTGV